MLTTKEKIIKIIQLLVVIIVVDFIASSFLKLSSLLGTVGYLLSYSLIIIYGLYLLRKKDDFLLKFYFYAIIILGVAPLLLRIINNL